MSSSFIFASDPERLILSVIALDPGQSRLLIIYFSIIVLLDPERLRLISMDAVLRWTLWFGVTEVGFLWRWLGGIVCG